MTQSLTLKQRMRHIIDYAYMLFGNQVAGGGIHIENEASMQLHLSNILLQLGRLNVFSPDEYFYIVLEKKIQLVSPTSKSKNKKARVDIWIEIKKGNKEGYAAAIELKYLKRSKTAAVTDARHSVYKDLENLEHYAVQYENLMTCEIVCSDNPNFAEDKGMKFSIANNTVLSSYDGDPTYDSIHLSNQYPPLKWDRFGEYNFLKISQNDRDI